MNLVTGIVLAQTPATPPDVEALAEITVTASRAAVTGFTAPTPTSVVSRELIERQGASNVAQVLNQIPAFKATISPTANGVRTQAPGASTADLRGLGAQRTLVLVNGMRVVPQAPTATTTSGVTVAPDLNQISSLMVERVEVVTGGASAQWGSDAVSGVVNVILRNRFEGLEFKVQGGQSVSGDNEEYRIATLGGRGFFGDQLHVVAGLDYVRNKGIGDLYSRSWGREEYQIVANAAAATNGQPANLLVPNVHASLSRGGLITGPATFPLRNSEFLPGGTTRPFQFGALPGGVFMIGGQGQAFGKGVNLSPELERLDPYVRAELALGGRVSAFAEASYSRSEGSTTLLPARDATITIRRDNAFLPAAVGTAMDAAAITSFTMNRLHYDLGVAEASTTNTTPHLALGLQGELDDGWSWDGHLGWGRNTYENAVSVNRIRQRFAFATDAVLSGGQPVCRATLPGAGFNAAAAGCVPVNLFGDGAVTPAAAGYINGVSHSRATYEQTTAAANLKGQPFSTWAGPVAVAGGLEWRRESENATSNPIAEAGGFEAANATSFRGDFDVKEGYLETIVPLLSGGALAEALDLNAAVRLADYSSAGNQTTWKAGVGYEPLPGLRFRANRSRDIRAPALFELFSRGSTSSQPATVRGITATISANVSQGNEQLSPEKADTTTIGFVVGPVGGFRASVDYYDIEINDAITSLSVANIAGLCNLGQQFYCNAFTFNPATGAPVSASLGLQNAATLESIGYDFAVSYATPMPALIGPAPGSLEISLNGTYVLHNYLAVLNGGPRIDRAGENSQLNNAAIPHLRMTFAATYDMGRASATAQVLYVGKGKIDNTFNTLPTNTINDNDIPAIAYLNLFAGYDLSQDGRFSITGGLNNVFDKAPPPVPSPTFFTPTNGTYYDVIGRAYQVSLNYRF